ncbi:MAG: hypothetical protein KKD11_05950 [Candidatus Omnitrophica bacterium]|nr:hypothetical protein [Candidatus Omnitrophota bacterium]
MKNLGKKERMELTITGIGVIFLIFLVLGNVQKIQAKKRSMAKSGAAITSSMSAPISFEAPEIEESTIKEGWGRDPFSLGANTPEDIGFEGLAVNGIMWDEDNPLAIINDDVVKVGDMLGGLKVVEITKTSVVMEQNGERHTLNLVVY